MAAAIEVGVSEFLFSSDSAPAARQLKVRVTFSFDSSTKLETKTVNVSGSLTRFDWTESVRVTPDSRLWQKIGAALERRSNAALVQFVVLNETGRELGAGSVDLSPLATASHEDPMKRIQIVSAGNRSVGVLAARLRAFDLIQQIKRGGGGGMTPQREASSRGVDPDVRRAFEAYDTDRNGAIDANELRGALQSLGIASDAKGTLSVLRRYDTDGNSELDVHEFARLVADVKSHLGQVGGGGGGSPPRSPRSGVAHAPRDEIDAAFDEFDKDGSGGIDANELVGALRVLGLKADGQGARQILQKYATSSSGDIDRSGFAKMVKDIEAYQGAASPIRRTSLARSRIDDRVRAVFDEFDYDRSGDIDVKELQGALHRLGMKVSEAQAAEVLRRYDVNNADGALDLFEFDRLVRDLQRFQGNAAGGSGGGSGGSGGSGGGVTARVRDAFERFDVDRSGSIDAGELRAALSDLGMMTSAQQAREVLAKYDSDRNRTLDLHEFARLVQDLEEYQRGGTPSRSGGGGGGGGRGGSRRVPAQIEAAFREFDKDGNGSIDATELRDALRKLGLQTSAAQAREVLSRYDSQVVDAGLDVYEFEKLVEDLVQFMGLDPRTFGLGAGETDGALERRIAAAFERFDVDRNGSIDAAELRQALAHLGMATDGTQAVQVLRQYDTDRSGGIELREFGRLVRDLIEFQSKGGGGAGGGGGIPHDVRQAFAYFDKNRSGDIDASELKLALKHLGIESSSSQAASILRQYDADQNRTLDLEEFARLVKDIRLFMEGGGKEQIQKMLQMPPVVDLFSRHRNALDELFNAYALVDEFDGASYPTGDAEDAEIRAAFAAFDRDSSGGIDAQELTGALAKLGLQASSQQTQRVLARYDGDSSRQLELDEFRQLIQDLRAFKAGSGGADGGGGGGGGGGLDGGGGMMGGGTRTPRLLSVEELLSMVMGFNLIPKHLSEDDVLHATRDMQTSSTAQTALQPFRRQLFDECLLRLSILSAGRTAAGGVRSASANEPARRLEAFLRLLLVYDLPRMRILVSEHRLREACTVGDVSTVASLLRERVAVDARDYDGWTALMRAAAYGQEECAQALLHANASISQRGPNGFSALHWACEYGHLPLVLLLLRSGAAPADLTEEAAWTPLQRAAIDGHHAIVGALLNHNKDKRSGETSYPLSSRDKFGDTALHDAARNGHLKVVKELVAHHAPIDAPNHAGETPIDVASKAGKRDVTEFLQIKLRTGTAARRQ